MISLERILVRDFQVLESDIAKAKTYTQRYGGRIEKVLVNMGSLPEDSLQELYATFFKVPMCFISDLDDWQPLGGFSVSELQFFVERKWVPHSKRDSGVVFATSQPFDLEVHQILENQNISFELMIADNAAIEHMGSIYLDSRQDQDSLDGHLSDLEEGRLREMATEAPTVNLLNSLIARALAQGASDMHLEPYKGRFRVRYRIDGVLHDVETLPLRMQLPIITRLKILSQMDIAEKRRPQDGKIEMRISNIDLDIRVSALPLNESESIVMRFLRKDSVKYDMSVLGLSSDVYQAIIDDLGKTAGVILMTGPTGSGKTTSLYTFLNRLNSEEVKIITLEDPVEYQLEGVNQVQVNSDIGFDFSAGLRSIVRQDPDIIMLGEIRDAETARIAMQSALTGHLVFSTVHTNDAPSAYTRLLDLGVDEFLLNAALVSIMAQRLSRKLCSHCAKPHSNADHLFEKHKLNDLAQRFNVEKPVLLEAVGCDHCGGTGYKGRMALLEYLRCDETIQDLPKGERFIPLARKHNAEMGFRTLLEDGLLKALKGETTIDEVLRVAG
ncbi:GspE/PulE family protein [Vibrio diabolicus]|uniref:GspE/PulE family protein n=1 Tax=Vibrio diabolicus TaxID=50719 RepID=UPI0015F5ED47|nr:GspE/PulE family protein [Vibrio diabolicus]